MNGSERIKAFWGTLRERSRAGAKLRRRLAATAAMALLFGGFLVAIGYGAIVLASFAAFLIVVAVVATAAAWPQIRHGLAVGSKRGRTHARAIAAASRPLARELRSHVAPWTRRACRASAGTAASAARRGDALGQSAGAWVSRTTVWIASRLPQADPLRDALRFNATGAELRRDGRYNEAVDCHRRALEILRALDDRRAVALTQSNVALALSHAGDGDEAIGLFEEAAATLHELGDEEHEAQIIANLGIAHRRHGRREEGDNVLELALSKLEPTSTAYQAIEAELRRAS